MEWYMPILNPLQERKGLRPVGGRKIAPLGAPRPLCR